MATTTHHARIFKVSASLLLSTAYFVSAIGVWMVAQGKINSSADSTPATDHQKVSLFATYSADQQACISKALGQTRFQELLSSATSTLTASETATVRQCLTGHPPAHS